MKAGIVTIYDVPNFGSVLQAFATQIVIETMGYEPVFIEYNRFNNWRLQHGGARKGSAIKSFIRRIGLTADHRKALLLNKFKREYFYKTHIYNDLEELKKENWTEFSLFVVGSDQVWNTNYLQADSFYLLSFVPESIRKISIASSFGMKSLPECYQDKFCKYLKRLNAISVRESNGIHIIADQLKLNVDAKLMLDPTLLLSKDIWNQQFKLSDSNKKEKYILFYMWAYAFEPRPYIYEVARYFQQKLNCKIIALEGFCSSCPKDIKMENRVDSTIPEFLNLFANAELIITSSFHGTAFALNYGRPLVSIIPQTGDDRQISLLNKLGVGNCGIEIGTPITSIKPYYDVKSEQEKLNMQREECLEWIREQIK